MGKYYFMDGAKPTTVNTFGVDIPEGPATRHGCGATRLLAEIVHAGDPLYLDELSGNYRCFYCGYRNHKPSCLYVRASELVNE
jgi:hypothetical protein